MTPEDRIIIRRPPIKRRIRTNEDEARWLEDTLIMRIEEGLATMGLKAKFQPNGLLTSSFSRWTRRPSAAAKNALMGSEAMTPEDRITIHHGLFRIAWRSCLTGHAGHGEPIDKATAEAWLKAMKGNGEIIHWIEPVATKSAPRQPA